MTFLAIQLHLIDSFSITNTCNIFQKKLKIGSLHCLNHIFSTPRDNILHFILGKSDLVILDFFSVLGNRKNDGPVDLETGRALT